MADMMRDVVDGEWFVGFVHDDNYKGKRVGIYARNPGIYKKAGPTMVTLAFAKGQLTTAQMMRNMAMMAAALRLYTAAKAIIAELGEEFDPNEDAASAMEKLVAAVKFAESDGMEPA